MENLAMDRTQFTVRFNGDLREIRNPFQVQSEFGEPSCVAYGDTFAERDDLQAALEAVLPFAENPLGENPSTQQIEEWQDALRRARKALGK